MTAAYFENHPTDPEKVVLRKPQHNWARPEQEQRINDAVAVEREACAMLCENEAWRLKKLAVDTGSISTNTKAIQASNDAAAIRARGYLYEQGQPSAQI